MTKLITAFLISSFSFAAMAKCSLAQNDYDILREMMGEDQSLEKQEKQTRKNLKKLEKVLRKKNVVIGADKKSQLTYTLVDQSSENSVDLSFSASTSGKRGSTASSNLSFSGPEEIRKEHQELLRAQLALRVLESIAKCR